MAVLSYPLTSGLRQGLVFLLVVPAYVLMLLLWPGHGLLEV